MRRQPKRRHRGFTLVELLIASLLSGVVLLSIYFVFIANSRQYYTQEQVVQMQETMRFALEVLKSDLRDAGQLAIVNGVTDATKDRGYSGPVGPDLRAVDLLNNSPASAPAPLTNNNNGLLPDQVRLLADASGGTLLAADVGGALVTLRPSDRQSSRAARDMVGNPARFGGAYKPGYFLRLMDLQGRFDLVPISNVNPVALTLQLSRAPQDVDVTEVRVNSVAVIRYRVAVDGQADPNKEPGKTDLIREMVSAADLNTALNDPPALTVAENVVNLQLWGEYDVRAAPTDAPSVPADADPSNDVGNWPNAVNEAVPFNTYPQRLRAVNVLLATRSIREDADLHTAPDRATAAAQRVPADRTWFDLVPEANNAVPTYARVATLTARVETPNLRQENAQ